MQLVVSSAPVACVALSVVPSCTTACLSCRVSIGWGRLLSTQNTIARAAGKLHCDMKGQAMQDIAPVTNDVLHSSPKPVCKASSFGFTQSQRNVQRC